MGRSARADGEPDPAADTGPDADVESFARQIMLRRLTDQPRTRADLADTLAKKRVPDEVARAQLDRFTDVGLIDDESFARSWVESRRRSKGLAGRALAHELRRKGVDDEIVAETIGGIDAEDERETARLLVRKKLRSMRSQDAQTQTRRLAGMLARKGYSAGVAFSVVREELAVHAEALDTP
ncbi:MAG: regulatory protein RecX [Mycobacteriales bacterium]